MTCKANKITMMTASMVILDGSSKYVAHVRSDLKTKSILTTAVDVNKFVNLHSLNRSNFTPHMLIVL